MKYLGFLFVLVINLNIIQVFSDLFSNNDKLGTNTDIDSFLSHLSKKSVSNSSGRLMIN